MSRCQRLANGAILIKNLPALSIRPGSIDNGSAFTVPDPMLAKV
jgi:hypothetical protein